MERRTYLRTLGAAGLLSSAGCLEAVWPAGSSNTILGPPSEPRGDPSHPIHGEALPSFAVPDPLSGETVTDADFAGERAILMTFFFTSCPDGACSALMQRLIQGQVDAADRGYADDVAFLAMTFDPEVDTPAAIETYAEDMGIDLEAGNWHFLRPESEKRAQELLAEDGFGNPAQKVSLDEYEEGVEEYEETYGGDVASEHDPGGEHAHGNESQDHGHDNESHQHSHDYTFIHYNLILLANAEGVVERSYPRATGVAPQTILEDLQTVAEG